MPVDQPVNERIRVKTLGLACKLYDLPFHHWPAASESLLSSPHAPDRELTCNKADNMIPSEEKKTISHPIQMTVETVLAGILFAALRKEGLLTLLFW